MEIESGQDMKLRWFYLTEAQIVNYNCRIPMYTETRKLK
jgi:hypothetical protein